jgi:CubicO group peptidase (beta-lactamase class C family)
MEGMNVTTTGYDFRPAHAAMQRYVDENLLSGFSSAVLVGRDLVDVKCIGWADKEAQTPLQVDHIFRVFSNTKLVTSYAALLLFEEGRLQLDDPIEQRLSGGSGLVSTLPDMVALIRSLLPGGPTLLKPDTIELMMTNQLPEDVWIRFAAFGELRGRGHGLAGALILDPSAFDHQDARGELFWGGRAGTQWWISPKKNTAGLIMAQREMAFAHPVGVEFKRLAYEAVKRKR